MTIQGKTMDEVALSHYETYIADEERVPEKDRKEVAESRITSFFSIKRYIEEFGTDEQKFSFNSTLIASVLLSSNYIDYSDSKGPLSFHLKHSYYTDGIESDLLADITNANRNKAASRAASIKKAELLNSKEAVENKNGLNIFYTDDGCRHEWYNKDGVHNGDYKIFNKNGILISLNDFFPAPGEKLALIVNGKQKEWYNDGSPKLDITFNMGKRDGFGVTFDEEGRIDQIGYYKDDIDVAWDSAENKKLVLREIKKYMEDGVTVYPVQYMGLCETLGYSGDWEEDSLQIITNVLDGVYK